MVEYVTTGTVFEFYENNVLDFTLSLMEFNKQLRLPGLGSAEC